MPVPVLVDCICVCMRSLYWYACLTAPAKKNYCHTTLFLHALESVRLAKMSNQHSGKHKHNSLLYLYACFSGFNKRIPLPAFLPETSNIPPSSS